MLRISIVIMLSFLLAAATGKAKAQDIPGVGSVAGLASRVVKAIDLKIQRLQNQTIWLQNAQKVLENAMAKLHLQEIAGWVQKQKDLYSSFYDELRQVKSVISYYHRVKEISEKQIKLVNAYSDAWRLLKKDQHFSSGEIEYMGKVYTGIIDASVKNIEQLMLVVRSFTTQMTDGKRLEMIDNIAQNIDDNYSDLLRFNSQNSLLALQRAKSENDAAMIKWMYGIE